MCTISGMTFRAPPCILLDVNLLLISDTNTSDFGRVKLITMWTCLEFLTSSAIYLFAIESVVYP